MANRNYQLRYYDCQGNYQFSLEEIISMDYGRKKNDLGIAVIKLHGARYNLDDFNRDDRLEIYRTNSMGVSTLIGQTCWFLRKVEIEINSECETIYTLTFYDTIHILTRRIVAWDGVLNANYPSHMLELLDTMLHNIVVYNYGEATIAPEYLTIPSIPGWNVAGAYAAVPVIDSWQFGPYGAVVADLVNRQTPLLTIPIPPEQSTLAFTNRFELENVLETMQGIAESSFLEGESLWFDIDYIPAIPGIPAQFTFKTWVGVRGSNRTTGTSTLLVGPEYGNMVDTKITYDWENYKNVCYAKGNGDDINADMSFFVRTDIPNCPFGYEEMAVSENFGDGTNTHLLPELTNAARIALAQNNESIAMSGKIISTDTFPFFEAFDYGDLVIAKFKTFEQFLEIAEYKVSVDNSGEEIEVPLNIDDTE